MKAKLPHSCILTFRQYNVWNILVNISQYSKKLFAQKDNEINAVVLKTSLFGKVYVTAWELVDMSYFAIQHSSRSPNAKLIISENDFVNLYHVFDSYKNDLEGKLMNNYRRNFLLFVHCFGGEQTKLQMVKPQMDIYYRTMYILDVIMRRSFPDIRIEKILNEKFDLSIEEFSTILFSSWAGAADRVVLLTDITNSKALLRATNIIPVLDYYSCTLEEIINSPLKRQIFYSKPLIKTSDNNYIVSNYYLLFFCFQECIYWIVRDYYYQQGSRKFTSAYGECFESYFHELLQQYLQKDQFERIPEGKTPKADWKLTIGEYKIIVEQKSSLIYIDTKQQTPDIDKAISFVKNNWGKAIRQLSNTEKEFDDGQYIKIILVAEDYYADEVLDTVFQVDDNLPENDGRYWLVTIDMMEVLLYTYKHSPELFFEIMEEKNRLELEHSNEGRSLFMIINKFGIESNKHIQQQKFIKYKDILYEIIKEDLEEDKNE